MPNIFLNLNKGCDSGCPLIINPVCGDDGNFYTSNCVLDKLNCILGEAAVKKLYNGQCESEGYY